MSVFNSKDKAEDETVRRPASKPLFVPLCLRVLCVNRPEVQPFTLDTARQILTSRSDFEMLQWHRRLPMPPLSIPVSHPLTTLAFI